MAKIVRDKFAGIVRDPSGGFLQKPVNKKTLDSKGVLNGFLQKYVPNTCEYGIKLSSLFNDVELDSIDLTYDLIESGLPTLDLGEVQGIEIKFSLINVASTRGEISVESVETSGDLNFTTTSFTPITVTDGVTTEITSFLFDTTPTGETFNFDLSINTDCYDVSLNFDYTFLT
jgi:hypothetical protein